MNKLFLSAVSAVAIAGVAVAADSTQFGVLPVVAPTVRTLVAVPWVASSTAAGDIPIANLILTANLAPGDLLDAIGTDGSSLGTWTLTEDAQGVLYWKEPTNMVTDKGVQDGLSANDATVARGLAVALRRVGGTGSRTLSLPFYVMGQVGSDNPSTEISPGQGNAPCYNMIAPPSTVAQGLNGGDHGATWEGTINENDRIVIPTQYLNIELKYADNAWRQAITKSTTKYYKPVQNPETKKFELVEYDVPTAGAFSRTTTTTTWEPYNTAIPVGTGFWYVSYGGSPTVTWSDVPTKN